MYLRKRLKQRMSVLPDPTEVPGLEVWHDGDDLSSITVVNDQVTIWNDKSGNNHHLGPVAGETLPSISSNMQNRRTGVFFDYTEKEMLESNYVASGTGSLSGFVVAKRDLGNLLPWHMDMLWSVEDQAIFAGIISFYFGQRAMSKVRSGK